MKDKHDIWTHLLEQIQGHSELRQPSLRVGGGTGQRCFACDETIREEHSATSQYHCPEGLGQVHWFHPECEAMLKQVRRPQQQGPGRGASTPGFIPPQ